METPQPQVYNHPSAERFELRVGEQLAFVSYSLVGRSLFLAYSEVPDELQSAGMERTLMQAAYEYARQHALTVVPICPRAQAFLEDVPEYREVVREQDR